MKHYMKKMLLFFFTAAVGLQVEAQRVVKGRVVDEHRNPLAGAVVTVNGKPGCGASTGTNGTFSLRLPDNKDCTLRISYIGFISEERKVRKESSAPLYVRLQEDAVGVETVVVTGTRTPKLLKDVPVITRVIDEGTIRQLDATGISDLLQAELPGLEFSYKMNQQVSLNMGGFGGNSLLFLIDGERMAGETMDNVDYSRLNLNNIERVEIVKGASSSLYGSNAVGGVVNIITKEACKSFAANLNAHYGQPGNQRYGASVSFKKNMFSNVADFQYTHDDAVNLTADNRQSDFGNVKAFKTFNVRERVMFQPVNGLKLTARAGYFYRERGMGEIPNDRYRDFSGGLKGVYHINDRHNLELSYSFDQYDKSYYFRNQKRDVRNYSNVQNIVRGLYSFRLTKDYELTLGGDFMRDYLMSYQFADNGSHSQYVADGFLQADMNLTRHFNVIASARYDYYSDARVKRLTSKLAMMYKWNHCSLRASYAGGFRAPTLKEMYMDFNMANIFTIYGNKNLKPEISHNFLLSAEYMKGRGSLSLTGFYNFVDNRITTVWNQQKKGMEYINSFKVKIAGVEANAAVKYPNGLSARLSYAYTHEMLKYNELQSSGTRPHSATFRIGYEKEWKSNFGVSLFLNGRALSSVRSDQLGGDNKSVVKVKEPGYSLWGLICTMNFPKGFRLSYSLDNIFNYIPKYYRNNSPTTVGTTFSTTLSVDLEKLFSHK